MRTFLVLWMGCIPWVYVIYYGYYTILVCAIIGYGIIGGFMFLIFGGWGWGMGVGVGVGWGAARSWLYSGWRDGLC
jgi:hypothetical protein